jgi:TM2 domain-containing membrane protein YozV
MGNLLFPIAAIIICVFAVFYIFGTDQLYQYGVDQGINTGNNSHMFSFWTTLSQLPNYLWYGGAAICVLIGVVKLFGMAA